MTHEPSLRALGTHGPIRRSRRGNAATLGLSLVTLLGAAAMVVDIGFLYASQTEVQATVDAAALAGVGYFDNTEEGIALARSKAIVFAAKNSVMGEPLVLPDSAITTGFVDDDGTFVASTDPEVVSAMSIDHDQIDIPVFFSSVAFGRQSLSANAQSIAVRFPSRGAGRVSCFLPLAVPDCILEDTEAFEALELKLSSSNDDNAGWADNSGNPTPGSINDALLGQCDRGDASVGDDVYLNNGVINASLAQLASVLNGETTAPTIGWDTTRWGAMPAQMSGSTVSPGQYGQNLLEGPIVLFETPPGQACLSSLQFNQTKKITGFAWAVVYDVDSHGSGKNIRVKLDLTNEYDYGTTGGGLDTNVLAPGNGSLIY
ncbi:MAG: pilus assembly protein TadG-related protein [Myxococcota bacterium]